MIAPVNGLRGELAAAGRPVKNHSIDNRRALREMQEGNARRKAEEEGRKAKGHSKMRQFQNVESKLDMGRGRRAPEENPYGGEENNEEERLGGGGNFLKKKSGNYVRSESLAKLNLGKSPDEILPSPRIEESRQDRHKAAVPRERAELAPRKEVNFREENKRTATTRRAGPAGEDASPSKAPHKAGEVPRYLQQRKKRWEEEERIREMNRPDEDCPTGMQLMDDGERVETLRILADSLEETKALLFKMPLAVSTITATKKKNALEAKLREIEDAMKIFGRPKVYIAAD
jgi:hypothetical protein